MKIKEVFSHCMRTEAGLVATSGQNPPLLGLGSTGRDRLVQSVLPVLQGQDVHLHGSSLSLQGSNGIMATRIGHDAAKVAEDVLELSLVLLEDALLGSSQSGQSRGNDGEREAHVWNILRMCGFEDVKVYARATE